ncbi:7 transmembrane receptor (Secretin family) [Teratosphaeria destructans]|uniref:7 transmembrane receptor (Secretin family) n=1 Tax=Teratosphaeria destructans TaxID=418781 RepID=A0A9W7SNV7_9PEZI|nr:7 transmembrane receptor (Secretin family) [Teratosphaeria destructans]
MSNSSGYEGGIGASVCTYPFVLESDFPLTGGQIDGRFCAPINANLTCCLPCPTSQWVFGSNYKEQASAANWVSVGGFIANALLLLTFIILPEDKAHRHYLSIGLTVSLLMLSLAFVIPLSTDPHMCYNEITPDNQDTDTGCAWTGALLLAGAMGVCVWIFLRSVWTALRIIFDFKHTRIFKWVSIALGIGLPALFLALCMPITGVSYRVGSVCIPNGYNAFITWFVWLIVFSGGAACLLSASILYCFWKFALSAFANGGSGGYTGGKNVENSTVNSQSANSTNRSELIKRRQRGEWARVKQVLFLQWRTILLAIVVANESVYFGLIFVQQTAAAEAAAKGLTPADAVWAACLEITAGDADKCLFESTGLGLSQPKVVAALLLSSLLGPVCFLLMIRRSMFVGWWELLRDPKLVLTRLKLRKPSIGSEDFIVYQSPKHLSLSRPLGSEHQLHKQLRQPSVDPVPEVPENMERESDGGYVVGGDGSDSDAEGSATGYHAMTTGLEHAGPAAKPSWDAVSLGGGEEEDELDEKDEARVIV